MTGRWLTVRQVREAYGFSAGELRNWSKTSTPIARKAGPDGTFLYDEAAFVAYLEAVKGRTLMTRDMIAASCGIYSKSVVRWEQAGLLARYPSHPGGGWPLYDLAEVRALDLLPAAGEKRLLPIVQTIAILAAPGSRVTARVTQKTLARWADAGKIPCVRTPGGHRRYPETAIRRLAATGNPR